MRSETARTEDQRLDLRAFLLGSLDETEAERIEYSLLSDDQLYEILLATEEELIDEYLRGALSEAEASSLLGYLDRLPGGRARIDFARRLRHRLTIPEQSRSGPWRGFVSLRSAAAAAIVVSALALSYFSAFRREPPSLVLTTGLTRSQGEIPVASRSARGGAIHLELELGASSHDRYRATIYDDESSAVAAFEGLRANVSKRRILVALDLAVASLAPGDYSIAIAGETPRGPEPLANYVFRLTE